MGRYTKETALYDPGAIREDMQEAGSKAEKYITDYTDQGTFVHAEGTVDSPSATTANGVLISGTAVKIIRAGKVVAEYGTAALIGALSGNNVLIDSFGVKIRNSLTEVAQFSATLVELGKNSVNSVIQMCAGKLEAVATQYGASLSTENTYNSGNPGTYYSILTLLARHVYESLSSAASISLWAGTSGQSSRINYEADQHIFTGSVSASNVMRYEDTAETNANNFTYNTIVRLGNDHGVTNIPLTAACYVWSVGRNASNMVQFCTAANTSTFALYMRKCSGGSWGSWKSITFS